MKLYEEVTEKIITLIKQGTLKEADKLPSVRNLSRDLGVSINTVKEAYVLLENKNYIISKPQSGFYIHNINKNFSSTNSCESLSINPLVVSLCSIYSSQLKDGICPPEVELAISSIDSSFKPLNKLEYYFNNTFKYHGKEVLNYCMPPGNIKLREQIAIQSLRGGISVRPEEIIITSGCTDAITLALLTICNEGDTIAMESPMYFNFIQICTELKLKVIEIPNNSDKGLSFDTLKFVLEYYDIKAFIGIPSFNNPLGTLMSDEHKEELVNILGEYDIPLIEDDVYGEIYYTKNRPLTCKSFDKTGNVILCSSFSKTIAPGLRVGWIIPGKYYDKVLKKKTLFQLGTSGIPQIALSYFLKEGGYERHNRKLRSVLKKQLCEMNDFILKHFPTGTKVRIPAGGFVLWIECPRNIDTLSIYNEVTKKGIFFAPGIIFSMTGKYNNCLRVNGGSWNEEVRNALLTISLSMKEMIRI